MLQATITLAPAAGPTPLGGHITAARESGVLVDFAVVTVRPGDQQDQAEEPDSAGGSATGGNNRGPAAVADPGAAEVEPFVPGGVTALLRCYEASGSAGEITEVPADLGGGLVRLIFLGIGDGSARALRRAGAVLGRKVAGKRKAVALLPRGAAPRDVQAFAEGMFLGSYRYVFAAEGPEAAGGVSRIDGSDAHRGAVRLLCPGTGNAAEASAAVERAAIVAGAVGFARDLINTPSVRKSPAWLAEQAEQMAQRCGLGVRVRGGAELATAGFGGIVAVGSGSVRSPQFIELSYEPDEWHTHVVLVGKGITFDSGGLSLKPNDSMKSMKTDMAGGAAVMAVLSALGGLGVRARVTGLIAAAENMPSGSAMRPGDVITHFGGHTVEVLNTDAEGRLVLADALAYADQTLAPDVMVDLATLTGAARMALGTAVGAMFTDDDGLATELAAAGEASGERLWRLPLAGEYRDALDSKVADLANIGTHHGYGQPGAILAALFLREFTGGRPWAHLDIAGPARSATDEGENAKGGTGFGARALLRWLADL